jgi:hypothetical protein
MPFSHKGSIPILPLCAALCLRKIMDSYQIETTILYVVLSGCIYFISTLLLSYLFMLKAQSIKLSCYFSLSIIVTSTLSQFLLAGWAANVLLAFITLVIFIMLTPNRTKISYLMPVLSYSITVISVWSTYTYLIYTIYHAK